MATYIVETIHRVTKAQPFKPGGYRWPFTAADTAGAQAIADALLAVFHDPNVHHAWHDGNAARIISEGAEICWKPLNPPHGAWAS